MPQPSGSFRRTVSRLLRTNPNPNIPLVEARRRPFKKFTERELIQLESEMGRTLFGELQKGHRREFFNLNPHTWIWHEEWKNEAGQTMQFTTKYEIHEREIIKIQPGPRSTALTGEELRNFQQATSLYYERVMREVYGRDPHATQQ